MFAPNFAFLRHEETVSTMAFTIFAAIAVVTGAAAGLASGHTRMTYPEPEIARYCRRGGTDRNPKGSCRGPCRTFFVFWPPNPICGGPPNGDWFRKESCGGSGCCLKCLTEIFFLVHNILSWVQPRRQMRKGAAWSWSVVQNCASGIRETTTKVVLYELRWCL